MVATVELLRMSVFSIDKGLDFTMYELFGLPLEAALDEGVS